MSGIIWIIVVGFIAGIIARMLSPGPNNPSGFILTTLLGIAGAFLATWIGQAIGHYGPDQGAGFITATIGALTCCSSGTAWWRAGRFRIGISDTVTKSRRHPGMVRSTRPGISRFSGARGRPIVRCFASPRNDSPSLSQMHPRIHADELAGHLTGLRQSQETHELCDV